MSQLISSNSSMTTSRYLRLVFLALIDIMCTVPLGVFTVYIGNKGVTLAPWISWEDTHFNFSRVGLFPALLWRSDPSIRTSMELARWLPVVCAFLFFALFGFAEEAKKNYRKAFWAVMKLFGVYPAPPKQKGQLNQASYKYVPPLLLDASFDRLPGYLAGRSLSGNLTIPRVLSHASHYLQPHSAAARRSWTARILSQLLHLHMSLLMLNWPRIRPCPFIPTLRSSQTSLHPSTLTTPKQSTARRPCIIFTPTLLSRSPTSLRQLPLTLTSLNPRQHGAPRCK